MGELSAIELELLCKELRKDILTMIYTAGSGHPGGSLSATELMAVLFTQILKHDPNHPDHDERDRFILSKGHATPIYYSVLAHTGFIPHEALPTFRKLNSPLQGHPDKSKFPLVETSSGSLGQGISIAAGIAYGLRLKNNPANVYCLMGDGELDEGQVWESFATITYRKLSNLIIIIDHNKIQLDGPTTEVKNLSPLKEKLQAFGFNVIEIDGHDLTQVSNAYHAAITQSNQNMCTIILAHTIKGKGVSFMENTAVWHGKAPNKDEYEKAMQELNR